MMLRAAAETAAWIVCRPRAPAPEAWEASARGEAKDAPSAMEGEGSDSGLSPAELMAVTGKEEWTFRQGTMPQMIPGVRLRKPKRGAAESNVRAKSRGGSAA